MKFGSGTTSTRTGHVSGDLASAGCGPEDVTLTGTAAFGRWVRVGRLTSFHSLSSGEPLPKEPSLITFVEIPLAFGHHILNTSSTEPTFCEAEALRPSTHLASDARRATSTRVPTSSSRRRASESAEPVGVKTTEPATQGARQRPSEPAGRDAR